MPIFYVNACICVCVYDFVLGLCMCIQTCAYICAFNLLTQKDLFQLTDVRVMLFAGKFERMCLGQLMKGMKVDIFSLHLHILLLSALTDI